MKKFRKYLIKGIGLFICFILLLYILIFSYVTINKQQIIKQVTADISKKMNGRLSVGNVDLNFFSQFPQVSVALHQVQLVDSMFNIHHHAFFTGEDVYLRLSIFNLIKKKSAVNGFRIVNGQVYVYTDTSGYTNRYLITQKNNTKPDTASSKTKNELKLISLKNVRIIEDDGRKEKLHDIQVNELTLKLDDKDARTFGYDVDVNALVHSLAFNVKRGSFIKDKLFEGKFDMQYDKKLKQLQFDSIDVTLSGHPLNLSGHFDLEGPSPQFALRVHTKQINYAFGKSLLTPLIARNLSIVNIDKGIDVDADIGGPLKGGDPLINVYWTVKNSAMNTPFLDFDHASFSGNYTDEVTPGLPRQDPNSRIIINNFSAEWKGLPVSSTRMDILNLAVPTLTCDLNSHFPLQSLAEIIGYNTLDLRAGDAHVNITYKGPLAKNTQTNSFVNGVIKIHRGNMIYVTKGIELKEVFGDIVFKNSDVLVQNLQCIVLNNKLVMQGSARNLLTLINSEPTMARVEWNVYSPLLNLNNFIPLLKKKKKTAVIVKGKARLTTVSRKVDQVLQQGSLNVSLKADKLIYKKFIATNVNANLGLLEENYTLHNVSMDNSGGHINLSGSLATIKDNFHQARLLINLDHVDVNRVFETFDNFNQDGITSKNLEGKLTAKIMANLAINDEGKLMPNTVSSTVDFSLQNGALNNFEPLKKLQAFVFKKRDFDNIQFAELKDHLDINTEQVKISRMEIQSTVFSMFVEGTYGLKGNSDLSIQVPLSNLKRRKADYNPENIGTDRKGGPSIHVRGQTGPDGKIKFKLDLFNKYKKENAGNESTAQ